MVVMWGRVKGPQQMLRHRPSASSSDASSRVMPEPSSRPRVEAQQVPPRPEAPLASGARRRGPRPRRVGRTSNGSRNTFKPV